MSRKKLKEDIELLELLFPKTHDRFQVVSSNLDELSFAFVDNKGKVVRIQANIQDDYPLTSAIWFSESEKEWVENVLGELGAQCEKNEEKGGDPMDLPRQVHFLVTKLCNAQQLPPPVELEAIGLGPKGNAMEEEKEVAVEQGAEEESGDEEEEAEEESFLATQMEDVKSAIAKKRAFPVGSGESGSGSSGKISPEGVALLARLDEKQREQERAAIAGTAKANAVAAMAASNRLKRELTELFRSEGYKNGTFSFDLENENLFEWNVRLHRVDPDSPLAADLAKLAQAPYNQNHIHMRFTFKEAFPFEPPFVRVVSPVIDRGFVTKGGAICMELLTKQGWSSAYSMESLITQISASLVSGEARIGFGRQNMYSLPAAQQSYAFLVDIHQKTGWGQHGKN